MTEILYFIFIEPIKLLLETIFLLMYRLGGSAGLAIVAVSLTVNFLILPLYKKSDAMQEEENKKQKQMSKWVKHIRKTFKGDERFMMLSAYYREQNYQPVYAIRGSLSLLLQIPFFIAAYSYLSSLTILEGSSFWILRDLSQPDQLLKIGNTFINVLPIIMTLINFLSGMIYTRGVALKEKLQLYILAVFFLVFLYDCPSGLVLYWTLNNAFSLCKNIFMKVIPNPQKVFGVICTAFGFLALLGTTASGHLNTPKRIFFVVLFLYCSQIPILLYFYKKYSLERISIQPFGGNLGKWCKRYQGLFRVCVVVLVTLLYIVVIAGRKIVTPRDIFLATLALYIFHISTLYDYYKDKLPFIKQRTDVKAVSDRSMFLSGAGVLVILLGAMIPVSVISNSPTEFVDINNYINPLRYIVLTTAICIGLFLVWGFVVFQFGNEKVKRVCGIFVSIVSIVFLANYMFFEYNLSTLSSQLQFDPIPTYTTDEITRNLMVDLILVSIVVYMYKKKKYLLRSLLSILLICGIVISAMGCVKVEQCLVSEGVEEEAKTFQPDDTPILKLSRTGKNVVVIMLDRAIGAYVPYIMEEKPELKENFSGFTYYPNTLSFGGYTIFAVQALYGGYEYTPTEMNKRDSESLADKHNEALLVMPTLFSENDYEVTVCDPPYAGYTWFPKLSIYDGLDNVSAYHCETGNYLYLLSDEELAAAHPELMKRNFFFYSLFKACPAAVQRIIYDNGNYLSTTDKPIDQDFLNAFAFLKNIPNLTTITDEKQNQFLLLQNGTTHEAVLLRSPNYLPSIDSDFTENGGDRTIGDRTMKLDSTGENSGLAHYDVNMAAFIQISNWITYLKKEGVYDNTRIILVSDHGRSLSQFENLQLEGIDVEGYNPLLMVKDFNDNYELRESDDFMTNGDVPSLAVEGVINNPINPYTGKEISNAEKTAHKQIVTTSDNIILEDNDGNIFNTEDAPWYAVEDNIFDESNWEKLETDGGN